MRGARWYTMVVFAAAMVIVLLSWCRFRLDYASVAEIGNLSFYQQTDSSLKTVSDRLQQRHPG